MKASAAYGREDLAGALGRVRDRLADPTITVLVVGEFKQGKSTLVNGLVDAWVCPVDVDVATCVPTAVGFGERPAAWACTRDGGREPIDVTRLDVWASERGNPANHQELAMIEVELPRPTLAGGLRFVDTPGVGGLTSTHALATLGALESADAVLFVSDASQEYTAAEVEFLERAASLCPTVAVVVTKIDLHPSWRRIVELDRGHLDRRGLEVPLFPVSSELRIEALGRGDRGVNRESGFPVLVDHLRRAVENRAGAVAAALTASRVRAAAAQLEQQFESERAVLADPERAAAVQRGLHEAAARAQALRDGAARWQQALSDGVTDLTSDVDHDLRERIRAITQETDARIGESDPANTWPDTERWLEGAITDAVSANFALLTGRAREVSELVGELFAADQAGLAPEVGVLVPLVDLDGLEAPLTDGAGDRGVKARLGQVTSAGLTSVRGAMGGFMMFNMIGSIAGMAIFPPAVIGVAAVLGRKALRDEKQRRVAQRRQQATSAARKVIDQVSFQVGKSSRDALRSVQRELRDHFTERASELQRSLTEAHQAAQAAGARTEHERATRLPDVEAELRRIRALGERADALAIVASAAGNGGEQFRASA